MPQPQHNGLSTRLTWQASVVLFSLIVIGCTSWMSLNMNQGDTDPREIRSVESWFVFYKISTAILLLASYVAVSTRLQSVREPSRQWEILNQLALGLATAVGAVLVTLYINKKGFVPTLSEHRYLIPTGLYVFAMIIIANAMNPEHDP